MKIRLYQLFLVLLHVVIMKNFLRLVVGMRFSDNSALKSVDQFVFISNHNSHLDSPSMYCSIPPSIIHNVNSAAAHDFYGKNAFMRAIAWCFNSRFIYRTKVEGAPKSMDVLEGIIQEGHSLMAFPEGSRGEPGVMCDFKPGVGVLLKRNPHVPFIPAYLHGVEKAMPRGSNFFIPYKYNCSLNIGKPIYISEDMEVDDILNLMKEEILKLNTNEA